MTQPQKAALLFALGLVVLVLAWWTTVGQLADILWNVDIYSHGLLVPFISLWLIWREEDEGLPRPALPSAFGAALLLPIALVWLVGEAMEASIVQHVALVLAIQAMFLAVYGGGVVRRHLFALFFLFFMIPAGDGLILPLQKLTTAMVTWGLDVAGIQHQTEGVFIQLSGGLYEVAAACAGLKFFFTSIVTGVLLCHLAFTSWRRRMVMLLASVLVPVVANAGRVFTILLIAEATDQDFAKGVDHIVYGWVFLSFVLLILIACAYRLSDKGEETAKPITPASGSWALRPWHAALLLPIVASLWISASTRARTVCELPPLDAPECEDCAYRLLPSVKGQIPFELNGADATATMLYRDGGQRFSVFAAAFMPDRRGHRMVQGPYRTLRDDWLVFAGAPVSDQTANGITYAETVVWRGAERQLVWRAYLTGGKFVGAGDRAVKLELGLARLLGRSADGATVIVATSMEDGIEPAREALKKFLSTFPPDRFLWEQLTDKKDGAVCAE